MNTINTLDYNQRVISRILPRIAIIHEEITALKNLPDTELNNLYHQIDKKLLGHAASNRILALISIASTRTLSQTPYDVQIIGAILVSRDNIIEMATGEGKTLVAAIAALHNVAFDATGSTHIITANDYLVARDYQQMKPLYDFFRVSSGHIVSEMAAEERKLNYLTSIVYATSSELGFDCLRDSLAIQEDELVQRPFCRAIVDEADSNMLDEANTPLIISSQSEQNCEGFILFNDIIKHVVTPADVRIDRKDNQCYLLDSGFNKVEQEAIQRGLINDPAELYSEKSKSAFYINCCIQAHFIYLRDQNYLVRDQEVVIISDKTGRAMRGRRWSDGIHQAIEAKEGIEVKGESQTLATITMQNFFKSYPHLSGMTGTAVTDAIELNVVYKLNTIRLPTNKPCIRIQHRDLVFVNLRGKRQAIINRTKACMAKYQPVLIGTPTVEDSEALSALLTQEKIAHQVLNARLHEHEAAIIAQAGAPGKVTIATNMAGRGTDIILGGRDVNLASLSPQDKEKATNKHSKDRKQVLAAGGLFVIGSDKHNLRRIDNQLIGRCARQGEPGESQFYISLEDKLIKNFVDVTKLDLTSLTDAEDEPIETPIFPIHKFIVNAQKMLESRSFEGRKELMKYDDVINEKRNTYLTLHHKLLDTSFDIAQYIDELAVDVANNPYGQQKLEQFLEAESTPTAEEIYTFYLQVRNQVAQRALEEERQKIVACLILAWQEYINYLPNVRLHSSLMSHAQKEPLDVFEKEANEAFDRIFISYKTTAIMNILSLWADALQNTNEQ